MIARQGGRDREKDGRRQEGRLEKRYGLRRGRHGEDFPKREQGKDRKIQRRTID